MLVLLLLIVMLSTVELFGLSHVNCMALRSDALKLTAVDVDTGSIETLFPKLLFTTKFCSRKRGLIRKNTTLILNHPKNETL